MEKPWKGTRDEESRSKPICLRTEGDCLFFYVYGCKVKLRVIRGMPEWEAQRPARARMVHYQARELPETVGYLRSEARKGAMTAEVGILHALRLICDEVLQEVHFRRARVASDRIHFDAVNIGTDDVPLFMNIEVLQPPEFASQTEPHLMLVA